MAALKAFTETLREIRQGALVDELSEQLRELVQRIGEVGGSGSLTLTIKLKRASKGSGNTLLLSDDIKVKKPIGEKGETILFATGEGELQRNDPRQPSLLPNPKIDRGQLVTMARQSDDAPSQDVSGAGG